MPSSFFCPRLFCSSLLLLSLSPAGTRAAWVRNDTSIAWVAPVAGDSSILALAPPGDYEFPPGETTRQTQSDSRSGSGPGTLAKAPAKPQSWQMVWRFWFDPKNGKPFFDPLGLVGGPSLTNRQPQDHPWHYGPVALLETYPRDQLLGGGPPERQGRRQNQLGDARD